MGGAYGASEGETTETVEETEATLNRAVVDLNIQEAMRDRLFQIAQQETRYPLVLLTEQASSARDAVVVGGSSARQETDTTLKVCVPGFGLEGGEINSPVQLFVIAHARIVKVSDGTELYADRWTYWGGSRKFVDWAADNAQPLRTELERAVQTLAETIVEELFLVYRIPDRVQSKSSLSSLGAPSHTEQ